KVFYFEGVTHLTLGQRGEVDVFTHMRSHGYITMGVGKLWHWEPIGEPFTRGTGAHFPKWGTYSQEWGCGDKDSGANDCEYSNSPGFHKTAISRSTWLHLLRNILHRHNFYRNRRPAVCLPVMIRFGLQ
ncbi:MAG: hypothetical protein MKZ95_15900, partial [Pirellulales bacterium]|nr:hypothetical protein [Pirellulales bacterium]